MPPTESSPRSNVLERFNRVPARGAHRLVCIPHAGAGAAVFVPLAQAAPEELEIAAVRLPGREKRALEEPFKDAESAVRHIVQELAACETGRFSVLGQCSGAYLALEVARRMADRHGRVAHRVLVASQLPPEYRAQPADSRAADEAYVRELVASGQIPAAMAQNAEFMELVREAIHADLSVMASYLSAARPAEPIGSVIVSLTGRDDPHRLAERQEGWAAATAAGLRRRTLDAGHFLTAAPQALMECLVEELGVADR